MNRVMPAVMLFSAAVPRMRGDEPIDGAVALIMALGWFIRKEAEEPPKEYQMLII